MNYNYLHGTLLYTVSWVSTFKLHNKKVLYANLCTFCKRKNAKNLFNQLNSFSLWIISKVWTTKAPCKQRSSSMSPLLWIIFLLLTEKWLVTPVISSSGLEPRLFSLCCLQTYTQFKLTWHKHINQITKSLLVMSGQQINNTLQFVHTLAFPARWLSAFWLMLSGCPIPRWFLLSAVQWLFLTL